MNAKEILGLLDFFKLLECADWDKDWDSEIQQLIDNIGSETAALVSMYLLYALLRRGDVSFTWTGRPDDEEDELPDISATSVTIEETTLTVFPGDTSNLGWIDIKHEKAKPLKMADDYTI